MPDAAPPGRARLTGMPAQKRNLAPPRPEPARTVRLSTTLPRALRSEIARSAPRASANGYASTGGSASAPVCRSSSSCPHSSATSAGCRSKNSREATPSTPVLPSSSRFTFTTGISPPANPSTSSRPSGASDRRLSVIRSLPTGSSTMSTARSPTRSRTAASHPSPSRPSPCRPSPCRPWLSTAWSAPHRTANSRFASSPATAIVRSPSAFPSCTAAVPTPPAAPCTSSVSPACARARRTSANRPVR